MSQTNQFICLNRFDVSLCFFRPGSSQSVFVYCITIWIFLTLYLIFQEYVKSLLWINFPCLSDRVCFLFHMEWQRWYMTNMSLAFSSCIHRVIILWHVIITCNYAIIIHFWTAAEVEVSCDSRVHINCH